MVAREHLSLFQGVCAVRTGQTYSHTRIKGRATKVKKLPHKTRAENQIQ
ncbi:hypothetical protein OOU_Y34scaffold00174g27 [Pyricularia oryzae Y34]|uniref:Uncharacterized protein n=2 Tax=Pyricularia oryzae TaxID=318829 RepID=A0AA97P7G8_PYRO3|nr:hypothetical protein OOU_Y34scaffold00174g27 [Pyricularia oryzae Y34]